jgi:hypothetical protein
VRGWTDIAGLEQMTVGEVLEWNDTLDALEQAERRAQRKARES